MDRPFYSVLPHLNDFYGIDMKDDQFENIAMHAWDQIGNKKTHLYSFRGEVINKRCALPCNVDFIEAVTNDTTDVNRATGNYNDSAYHTARNTQDRIDASRRNSEPYEPVGGFEDYTLDGNTLVFKEDIGWCNVLYQGVLADDNGLPTLNFKEIDAIAKYCAWVDTQKKAMITKDKATFELAMLLRQQWQIACDDARTPTYLNQNDMDNILNVNSSWDRKRFGLTYKSIR